MKDNRVGGNTNGAGYGWRRIENLFDRRRTGDPLVSYALMSAMAIVTLPTVSFPWLQRVFGGLGTLRHPWQIATSVFEHGWLGIPAPAHLAGNLFLMSVVGVAAEKLLGPARFLILTFGAVGLYWVTRAATGFQANGASVFIWAYAPPVFVALWHTRKRGRPRDRYFGRCWLTLLAMWIPVTIGLAVAAHRAGVGWLAAVPAGNAFHLAATLAGVIATLLWRGVVVDRLLRPSANRSLPDRIATRSAAIVPVVLAMMLLFAVGGAFD